MDDIKQELLELKFNVDSVGIFYWIEAIKFVKENPLVWDMTDIYENVAKIHNATKYKVERLMRYAMLPAMENIQRKYGYYAKIKNQTFLDLIRFKLI